MISYFRTLIDETTRTRLSHSFDLHNIQSIKVLCKKEHDMTPFLYQTLIYEQQIQSKVTSEQVLSRDEYDNTTPMQLSILRRPRPMSQPPTPLAYSKHPSFTEYYDSKRRNYALRRLCRRAGYVDPQLLSRLKACVARFLTTGIREHPKTMKFDALMYLIASAEMESCCCGNLSRTEGQSLKLVFEFEIAPEEQSGSENGTIENKAMIKKRTERIELDLQTPAYYQPDYDIYHTTHSHCHDEMDEDLFWDSRRRVNAQLAWGNFAEWLSTMAAERNTVEVLDLGASTTRSFRDDRGCTVSNKRRAISI